MKCGGHYGNVKLQMGEYSIKTTCLPLKWLVVILFLVLNG
jgi:hypothetical protein